MNTRRVPHGRMPVNPWRSDQVVFVPDSRAFQAFSSKIDGGLARLVQRYSRSAPVAVVAEDEAGRLEDREILP